MHMTKRALMSAAFSCFAMAPLLCAQAAEQDYTLDPTHAHVVWMVNHFGFSNPSGSFSNLSGSVVLDEQKPENSKVSITIDLASVMTGVPKLDEHLRSKDFFDVAKYANATFVSDSVLLSGTDTAKVHGKLMLHGVTKPVTLVVKLNKIGESPVSKKKTAGFSATTTLKRSDFNISFGLPGISDEVKINIEAEAVLTSHDKQ
jgi:polyisoprenoid-binding protein YceI